MMYKYMNCVIFKFVVIIAAVLFMLSLIGVRLTKKKGGKEV